MGGIYDPWLLYPKDQLMNSSLGNVKGVLDIGFQYQMDQPDDYSDLCLKRQVQ